MTNNFRYLDKFIVKTRTILTIEYREDYKTLIGTKINVDDSECTIKEILPDVLNNLLYIQLS